MASVPTKRKEPLPGTQYGSRRLAALYGISKLLTRVSETPEETVQALLAILTKEIPLRCAILNENVSGQPRSVVWHSPEMESSDVQAAKARALEAYRVLTPSVAARLQSADIEEKVASLPPVVDITSNGGDRGRFITSPLVIHGHPIFGALHVEGVAPFKERDVEFVSAITNQLAVALDRNQARLHEVSLRKQAEAHNAFKTSLVSVVSHEVGNSLAIMKMAAFLLKEKLPPDILKESDRLFEMIVGNIESLTRAVQNLLNMGRLEAGKLAINFAPTDAAKLLRDVAATLALPCEQKSLHVSFALPDGLPLLKADLASLTLVVSNLMSNAIKYTPAGGDIVLGVTPEPARPGFFRVYVQDSGIGVSEGDRAKILGGHFRSESGKTMTSKGFGVGLSLAKQIVEAHESTIGIEGAPGKGSRFSFLLPAA